MIRLVFSLRFQEDFDGGKWRLLALDLAAGDQKFKASMRSPVEFRFFLLSSSLCRIWTYQKLSPYCSRGSSRKQYSHFLCGSFAEVRFAGICHCVLYISYEQHIKISHINIYTYIALYTM